MVRMGFSANHFAMISTELFQAQAARPVRPAVGAAQAQKDGNVGR